MSKNNKRRAKKRDEEKKRRKKAIKQLNSRKITYEKAFELLEELKSEN